MQHLSRLPRFLVGAISILFLLSTLSVGADLCAPADPAPSLEPPKWPRWVHRHWVWENSGTQESAWAFVNGFLEHDIPVGAVIIDRPWQTEPNTFVPDPALYPDLGGLIEAFHAIDVRVFLWVTSVINVGASNYGEALANGYFLSGGKTISWWGGEGSLLDYTNPEAVAWWHAQIDPILDLGIDGWKCDATDPYILTLVPATGYGGRVTWEEYKDAYYRDFFDYTRRRLGPDRVITARPSDDYFVTGIPLSFAPVDVNFAGWVGDQDPDFSGLRVALSNMFTSAELGYVSFGSDIGGFRNLGEPYPEAFVRWAQLGALCPIMENGGSGEHRPWIYGERIASIYRTYTRLHEELIPYIYSEAAYSFERGISTMRPQKGVWTYLLGDAFLVAPFYEPGERREIYFPEGEWIDFFEESKSYRQGVRVLEFPWERFPLFVRRGAIVPMEVEDDTTGHGRAASAGHTSVLLYPAPGRHRFGYYEEGRRGFMIRYEREASRLLLSTTPTPRRLLFRIHGDPEPGRVTSGGAELPRAPSLEALVTLPAGWAREAPITWIRIADASEGVEIVVDDSE